MKIIEIEQIEDIPDEQVEIEVKGWIRTVRDHKKIGFIHMSDGTSVKPLQVVIDPKEIDITELQTGDSICVKGHIVESPGKGQKFDFRCHHLELIGDALDYPIQPKKHSMEFFREMAHLRPRTDLFSSIFKIRSKASDAIHRFFQDKDYTHIHTPILTSSDCEGAGETFGVTPDTFFGEKEASLTVSGQLHAEAAMMGLGKVYTFGPTFRAEKSFTTRHLSEFWMVEPEIAFADLDDITELSVELLKYVISFVMSHCQQEIDFLSDWKIDDEMERMIPEEFRSEPLESTLLKILECEFTKITYSEAIDILRYSKLFEEGGFEHHVEWGVDLKAEHEKYLVDVHFGGCPIIVTDYPSKIKAFYMKADVDGTTVRAMDVLFPRIGEIIGGSQREEDCSKLIQKMSDEDISQEHMSWYTDTRRYGTIPHAGFGLGFDRLVQFITGMDSIKDVTLFPVSAKSCKF